MSVPCQQDLTEQVHKVDENYFAYGDHSDVYKGRYLGQVVVIKELRGVNTNKTDVRDALLQSLREQMRVWTTLEHPNVCKIYGLATGFGFLPALILEFFEKGNIIKYIRKNNPSTAQRTKWVSQIASGLDYLHSKGLHHGDLRGPNVFLDDKIAAVIADYGISQYFSTSDFTSAKSVGTVRWMAPELVALPPKPDVIPEKTDVFALAMIMLEIFSGQPPYSDKSDTAVIFSITKHEIPKLPEEITGNKMLLDLFQNCTRQDPLERPSAKDVSEILSGTRNDVPTPTPSSGLLRWFFNLFGFI